MDEGGKCHKVETICVINNGNARNDVENGVNPDLPTHEHLTTNHKSLPSEIF